MAISDVLSAASEEIRDYLDSGILDYSDLGDEIQSVLGAMDALRIKLDTPPLEIEPNEAKPEIGHLGRDER